MVTNEIRAVLAISTALFSLQYDIDAFKDVGVIVAVLSLYPKTVSLSLPILSIYQSLYLFSLVAIAKIHHNPCLLFFLSISITLRRATP